MVYGVRALNYLKGYYCVFIFSKKSIAQKCFDALEDLWENPHPDVSESEIEFFYEDALENCIDTVDELSRKSINEDVIKDFIYYTSDNGNVIQNVSNIRFIGGFTTIPA